MRDSNNCWYNSVVVDDALKELNSYRDLLNALLLISIALISVAPLFVSLRIQRKNDFKKKNPNWPAIILFISFISGIVSIAHIYSWFMSPIPSTRIWVTLFTGIQIILFAVAIFTFWPWFTGNETEVRKMSKAIKLDGYYLDSQFRRVQIYICEKTTSHHFDMPTDQNQRTDQEKKWATILQTGDCPLC